MFLFGQLIGLMMLFKGTSPVSGPSVLSKEVLRSSILGPVYCCDCICLYGETS